MIPAIGTFAPGVAGTWDVGLCIANTGIDAIAANQSIAGFVQITN